MFEREVLLHPGWPPMGFIESSPPDSLERAPCDYTTELLAATGRPWRSAR